MLYMDIKYIIVININYYIVLEFYFFFFLYQEGNGKYYHSS